MSEDQVITLANNKKYLLLLETDKGEENYFLAVLMDANNEPTQEYVILKEVEKDGESYAQKIDDPLLQNELIANYKEQYADLYQN